MSNSKLIPERPVKYFKGKISFFRIYNWGIIGTLEAEKKNVRFKIINTEKLEKYMMIGLDLVIRDGYCIIKEGNLIVMDGKYGKAELKIDYNYFSYSQEKIIETGYISDLKKKENKTVLIFKSFNPVQQENRYFEIFDQNLVNYTKPRDIIRITYSKVGTEKVQKIEKFPSQHFLYQLLIINQGETSNTNKIQLLFHQKNVILETWYEKFKHLIITYGCKISEIELIKLKDILYNKFYWDPCCLEFYLLFEDDKVDNYFMNMYQYVKEQFMEGNFKNIPISDLLLTIKYNYPKIKKI